MEESHNRIAGIDYLKVLGLYLMVLGHSPFLPDSIEKIIYSFHMPFFFILSGILFKNSSWGRVIKSSISSLLIPYLCINLICLGLWCATEFINGTFLFDNFLCRVGAICLGLGYERFGLVPVCSPLWFLLALFWCRLATCFYAKCLHNRVVRFIFILTIIIAVYLLNRLGIQIPFALSSALLALPFMLVAYESKHLFLMKRSKNSQTLIVVLSILITLPSFSINYVNSRSDIDAVWFGQSIVLFYLNAFATCTLLFVLFYNITKQSRIITSLSTGAIAIVGFHLTIAYYICKLNWLYNINSIVASVLESAIVLFLCYPIILICKQHFPFLIGNRSSNGKVFK